MKKIIISILIFLFAFGVLAKTDEIPASGLTPDSSFYFLKAWKESVQTFFTFGAENKAKQYLHLAEVRLAEYQKMIEKGKTEIAEKTLKKYEKQLNNALEKTEELKNKGKDVKNLSQKIEDAVTKHLEVLQENLQKVPEQAKKGIENAIENSRKQIEKITGKKDETADWKTYRNEKYGFEFRYPGEWARNDWQVSGTTVLGTDFSSPDYKVRSEYRGGDFPQEIFEKGVQLAIYIDSFAAYSPYTFEELKSDRLKDSRVSKITEIEVAGERALYQAFGDYIPENAEVGVYFFSPKDNALLFTVYLKSTIEEKDSQLSVFNQILSTFKFTSR